MSVQFLSYPLSTEKEETQTPIALAIGYFDGVHLGHQAVIRQACSLAEQLNVTPAVMTFDPHPSEVLGKSPIWRYITPLKEKIDQFLLLGVKKVYVLTFDLTLACLSKEAFVAEILCSLHVRAVITGFNFTFGKGGKGTPEDLMRLGKGFFKTEQVDPVVLDGLAVSSTLIRKALVNGQIGYANAMLGKPYMVEGKVITGDGLGRQLGFPTANLSLSQRFIVPKYGVYIVRVHMENHSVYGLMNVGVRPTMTHSPKKEERFEVHLLDWDTDIYGEKVRVEFLHYLREEKRFSSVYELSDQIRLDLSQGQAWLLDDS